MMHQWPMPYGTHAFSSNALDWQYAPVTNTTTCSHNGRPCAYDGTVLVQHSSNDSSNVSITKLVALARERPHLLLDEHGTTPLALSNGMVLPQLHEGTGKPCKQAPPAPAPAPSPSPAPSRPAPLGEAVDVYDTPASRPGVEVGAGLGGVGYGCDRAVTFVAPIRQKVEVVVI